MPTMVGGMEPQLLTGPLRARSSDREWQAKERTH